MNKILRIALFITLILAPIVIYKYFYKGEKKPGMSLLIVEEEATLVKPKIALIFDDLGESLRDLEEIYSLNIPATLSVVPGLKFSKNIAYMGSRCGLSILIHLPLEPKNEKKFLTNKYKFISSSLSKRENEALLRYYLNYIRVAIGVNNHMGSVATENQKLMEIVLKAIKNKGLIFIDSRTSLKSIACEVARKEGLICGRNEGFLDSINDMTTIKKKLEKLVKIAKGKGKIIIIAHPKKNTLAVLKEEIPAVTKEVDFITIKDYLGL
jgi:hypothetical protein